MFTYLTAPQGGDSLLALVSPKAVLCVSSELSARAVGELWRTMRLLTTEELFEELRAAAAAGLDNFSLLALSPLSAADGDVGPGSMRLIELAVGGAGRAMVDDSAPLKSTGRLMLSEVRSDRCERVLLTSGDDASHLQAGIELPIVDGIVRCSAIVYEPHAGIPRISVPEVKPRATTATQTSIHELSVAARERSELVSYDSQTIVRDNLTQELDHLIEPPHLAYLENEALANIAPSTAQASNAEIATSSPSPMEVDSAFASPEKIVNEAPVDDDVELWLILPNGTARVIDKPTLIGRRPAPPADADASEFHLIAIEDRGNKLSRLHARIDPHAGGVLVTDLDSTNGTTAVQPDGEFAVLKAHKPLLATHGAELRLGNAIVCVVSKRP